MTDCPEYKNYVSFLDVSNFPSSHWSVTSGWEWEKYLAQVEKYYLKENIEVLKHGSYAETTQHMLIL